MKLIAVVTSLCIALHSQEMQDASGASQVQRPKEGLTWRCDKSAGANALALLLAAREQSCNYQEMSERLLSREDGNCLTTIANEGRAFGCQLEVCKAKPADLMSIDLPVIAYLDPTVGNHTTGGRLALVVAVSKEKKTVEIIDAATCITGWAGLSDFLQQWSGIIIVPAHGGTETTWILVTAATMGLACAIWLGRRRPRNLIAHSRKEVRDPASSSLGLCLLVFPQLTIQSEADARSEVRQLVVAARTDATSLEVEYRYATPEDAATHSFFLQRLVFIGDSFIASESAHFDDYVSADDWPTRAITYYDGEHEIVIYWPNKLLFSTQEALRTIDSQLTTEDEIRHSNFVHATGWWPNSSKFRLANLDDAACDIAAIVDDDRYSVSISGDRMATVERAGRDKILLDLRCGAAVRERRVWAPDGTDAMTVQVESLHQVGKSTWLPSAFNVEYNMSKTRRVIRGELLNATANRTSIQKASFHLEDGMCFLDHNSHQVTQVASGGLDYLFRLQDKLRRRFSKQRAARQFYICAAVAGVLIVILMTSKTILRRRTVCQL
jgi:hypothetical protein